MQSLGRLSRAAPQLSRLRLGARSAGAPAAGIRGLADDSESKIERTASMMLSGPQANMVASSFSANQKSMTDRIFHAVPATSESEIRSDLRTAHRLVARYGWDDLTWNHISSRCSGTEEVEDCCDLDSSTYLITPGGVHFSEVREEDLVFDSISESGNVIHSGIYEARPDVRCIIHIHTPAILAVSCLKDGFKFLVQDAAPFYERLGYHQYQGVHTSDEERVRIQDALGPDGIAIIMRNHGTCPYLLCLCLWERMREKRQILLFTKRQNRTGQIANRSLLSIANCNKQGRRLWGGQSRKPSSARTTWTDAAACSSTPWPRAGSCSSARANS